MDVREKLVELFYDNNVRCDQKIEGLADDVMDIIAHGVTVQEWIPVTERWPEYETEVLTYRKSGISVETRWRTYWDYDEFSDSPVTHWAYLPEPPKGE